MSPWMATAGQPSWRRERVRASQPFLVSTKISTLPALLCSCGVSGMTDDARRGLVVVVMMVAASGRTWVAVEPSLVRQKMNVNSAQATGKTSAKYKQASQQLADQTRSTSTTSTSTTSTSTSTSNMYLEVLHEDPVLSVVLDDLDDLADVLVGRQLQGPHGHLSHNSCQR